MFSKETLRIAYIAMPYSNLLLFILIHGINLGYTENNIQN